MRCETSHDSCAVADVDVPSLMSDIKNELHWIFLFRLFFMFIWSVSVWASVSSSLQYVNAQSAIKTNHVHRQSSCSLLHFRVLLHVSSLNVTSAWSIENMLYTLHATYIEHNLYADFSLRLERLLKEFSCDRFTVQDERDLSLLRFRQFTS